MKSHLFTESPSGDVLAMVEDLLQSIDAGDLLGGIAAEQLKSKGKRVRARLALEAAVALGAHPTAAVPWAAAVEMVHNASLVHDDLQDQDRVRRGVPTMWVVHGAAQAINAGDLMLTVPYRLLDHLDASDALKWSLARALSIAVEEMARGQASEPSLRGELSWEAYLRCARRKTGALLAVAVEGAALIAGHPAKRAARIAKPFLRLGELFQMQDDVLDLYGDKGRGQRGCDLDEGKVSALVVACLHDARETPAQLFSILDAPRGQSPRADIVRLIDHIEASGALDAVLARLRNTADGILADDELVAHQGLLPLAEQLVVRILDPISPLAAARAAQITNSTEERPWLLH